MLCLLLLALYQLAAQVSVLFRVAPARSRSREGGRLEVAAVQAQQPLRRGTDEGALAGRDRKDRARGVGVAQRVEQSDGIEAAGVREAHGARHHHLLELAVGNRAEGCRHASAVVGGRTVRPSAVLRRGIDAFL